MKLFPVLALLLLTSSAQAELYQRVCGPDYYAVTYDSEARLEVFITKRHVSLVPVERAEVRSGNQVVTGTTDRGTHTMTVFMPNGTGMVGVWDPSGKYIGQDACKADILD